MARNGTASGEQIDITATTANILSGEVVLVGTRVAVALADIAIGRTGAAAVLGIFVNNKLSTDTIAQGALVYWDNTNKRWTTTSAGNTLGGFCASAAGNGATQVAVSINA